MQEVNVRVSKEPMVDSESRGAETLPSAVYGYWMHFGPSDWCIDGVLQGTLYQANMSGNRGLLEGKTDGWGVAASLVSEARSGLMASRPYRLIRSHLS